MAETEHSGGGTIMDAEHVGANLGRAAAGALIFSLPMLMTMEMWWLGFYISDARLALLLAVTVPLLVGLSHYAGFEDTFRLRDDLRDALVALAVAALTGSIVLWLFNVIGPGMSLREVIGKIAMQMVPGSIGALLARSQMGEQPAGAENDLDGSDPHYGGELFVMAVGALFLSLNMAPTEEIILIAFKMSTEQQLVLILLSIAIMHCFVFAVNFRGESKPHPDVPWWRMFLHYSVAGYAVVFLVSLFILWIFGRSDGSSLQEILSASAVLSFPGALGAAAARLIL